MSGYSTRQVAQLLGMPEGRVRSFVAAGFLAPVRGPRNAYRFSFQDLVILRAAQGLDEAGIPPVRVKTSLARLREQLPRGRSLAAVRIVALGSQVVVQDGREVWEPETGQRPLPYPDEPALEGFRSFEVAEIAERAAPLGRAAVDEARRRCDLDAEDWYELGYELEATAVDAALQAYERALALDPGHADAHLNLGRLLHEGGELETAEEHYRRAARHRPGDPTAWFNLGVVLQDRGQPTEAIAAYGRALATDPRLADAHYNLAGLHSHRGDRPAALRHLKAYKALLEG